MNYKVASLLKIIKRNAHLGISLLDLGLFIILGVGGVVGHIVALGLLR